MSTKFKLEPLKESSRIGGPILSLSLRILQEKAFPPSIPCHAHSVPASGQGVPSYNPGFGLVAWIFPTYVQTVSSPAESTWPYGALIPQW